MATFVLVHGAWAGGWIWDRLRNALRDAGHKVFAPTLTGLGDRVHLATPDVGLHLHITDVVNAIEYEELNRIVLVGNSYAGMVITGVAERIAKRISHLVYLDAFVPRDGQALFDLVPPEQRAGFEQLAREKGDGWRVPLPFSMQQFGITAEVDLRWCTHRITPTPLKAFSEAVTVREPAAAALPRTFVYCNKPAMGAFDQFAQAARKDRRWQYHELATGHLPMVTAPKEVCNLLTPLAPHLGIP